MSRERPNILILMADQMAAPALPFFGHPLVRAPHLERMATERVVFWGHYLRRLGYDTCLCGKMHFVGPDQLHGFEERLTTDIYPADLGWTPDWERPAVRPSWYPNMLSIVRTGTRQTSNHLDFDEDVAFHALRKIYEEPRS